MLRNRLTDCFPPLPPLPPSSPYNYHQRGSQCQYNINVNILQRIFVSNQEKVSTSNIPQAAASNFCGCHHNTEHFLYLKNSFWKLMWKSCFSSSVQYLLDGWSVVRVRALVAEDDATRPGGKDQHFQKGIFVQKWWYQFVKRSGNLLRVKSPPICKGSSSSCFDSGNISPPTIWKTTKSEKWKDFLYQNW